MGQDISAPGDSPAGGQQVPPGQPESPQTPVPTPVPPAQPLPELPPLPPGSEHWDFYQRISQLRHINRQHAARATTLTNVAASISAGLCALGVLVSIVAFFLLLVDNVSTGSSASTGLVSSFEANLIRTLLAFLSVGISLAVGVYSVFVLTKASQLFSASYQEATRLFNTAGIAVLFAQEDFIKTIQDKLVEHSWIKKEGRSTYHKFEEHLDFCACHFPALLVLAHGTRKLNIWNIRREESLYKSRKWFTQQSWIYWTCGCLIVLGSLQGSIWTIVLLIYLIYGGRYIASRGVLVALCDFMLKEGAPEDASTPSPFKA